MHVCGFFVTLYFKIRTFEGDYQISFIYIPYRLTIINGGKEVGRVYKLDGEQETGNRRPEIGSEVKCNLVPVKWNVVNGIPYYGINEMPP
ncbi:hypothetical protein EV194_110100 [Natronoflexus pectinivorans]|uniref:Uncharacterized protein n=1 Tax=Natronoflexus pectinivorans TaxID=682526 RepID=A0A4R2GH41_9BACT|nr:hypothetical protein EV194_110100 [Natronoflexus pectinivorans]